MKNLADAKRILIIKLGALGDVMMAEGVMRCIRAHFKNAHITLLTEPLYARFMEKAPHFDAIIPHKRASRWQFSAMHALKKSLKANHYDLVIDLQNSSYSKRLHGALADAVICATAKNADIRYRRDRDLHLASRDYLRQQVELLGVDMSAGYFSDLRWAAADVSRVMTDYEIKDGFALLIAGSAARHPHKRWHAFPELISALAERNIAAYTAPGPDEVELCEALPAPMLMDDGKFLTLNQVIGLARHCGMVIGNDTGPTHMLAAAGTKGVALFGSDHSPESNTGISEIYETVEKPQLNDITVKEVLAAVDRIQSNSV